MTNVDLGLIFIYWHYMKKANAVSGIRSHAQKSETEAGGQFQLNLYGFRTQQTHIETYFTWKIFKMRPFWYMSYMCH